MPDDEPSIAGLKLGDKVVHALFPGAPGEVVGLILHPVPVVRWPNGATDTVNPDMLTKVES